jgi:transposase
MLHRARSLLDKQCTQLSNAIRGHLAEFGIVAAKGNSGFASLLAKIGKDNDPQIPPMIRPIVVVLAEQWRSTCEQMDKLERQIIAWHKSNSESQRLATIPQFGPIISSAVVASMGNASRFKSGRAYGASLGLVPRQDSTGGKPHLGPITKAGDHYIRRLLVNAAAGMVRRVRANPDLRSDALVRQTAGSQTGERGDRGACQQTGAYRLGDPSQRRGLSSVDDHHSLGRNALIVADPSRTKVHKSNGLENCEGNEA